jgi:glycine betaine/choline ABC-type transport system substrate-binding protein
VSWCFFENYDRIAVGSKILPSNHSRRTACAGHRSKYGLAGGRRFDLAGVRAQALVAGEIDTYVEYTGTALLAM